MYQQQVHHQYDRQDQEEHPGTLGSRLDQHTQRSGNDSHRKQVVHGQPHVEEGDHNLRLQYEREMQIWEAEMQSLKDQIELDQKEKGLLEDTITHLKNQRTAALSENKKLFQDNERHRQLLDKVKIDNKSMEMEIDRFRSQRKVYYHNINNIEGLKRDVAGQIAEKNNTIDELTGSLRRIEREHSECTLRMQEDQRIICQGEIQREELKQEIKNILEKYLAHGNLQSKLDYELKEANELNKAMKDRIYTLEEERKEMFLRLGYQPNTSRPNQSEDSVSSTYPINQKSMMEIKSYMSEIGNVLQAKKEETTHYRKGYQKLRLSILSLEENL